MQLNITPTPEEKAPRRSDTVLPNGKFVRELRAERELTQDELARQADLAKRTIENIEASTRVKRETLDAVAKALRVHPEQLIDPSSGPFDTTGPEQEGPVDPTPDRVCSPHQPTSLPAMHVQLQAKPAPVVPAKCSLLLVDDEAHVLELLVRTTSSKFEVLTATNANEAQAVFTRRSVDLILTDQKLPGRTGVQLLEWVWQHHPRTIRLLNTGLSVLEDAIDAINRCQVYHWVLKPWNLNFLLRVLRNAAEKFKLEQGREQLLEELRQANRELEEANQRLLQRTLELEREAVTDPLTGLPNRKAMEDMARFEVRRHNRYPSPLSVGLLAIDQCEYLDADPLRTRTEEALETLARALREAIREVDTVGRLHGEEFLLLARETGKDGAARLAERIQAAVALDLGQVIPITLSIGFAVAESGTSTSLESILGLCGCGPYENAGKSGGNRCVIEVCPVLRAMACDSRVLIQGR